MSLNEVSIKIPGEYIPNVFGQFDAFAKKNRAHTARNTCLKR